MNRNLYISGWAKPPYDDSLYRGVYGKNSCFALISEFQANSHGEMRVLNQGSVVELARRHNDGHWLFRVPNSIYHFEIPDDMALFFKFIF